MEIDVANARRAIEKNTRQAVQLLHGAPPGGRSVPGLKWSLAEVAAHLVSVVQWFEDYVTGRREPPVAPAGLPGFNDRRLAEVPTRQPGELAVLLEEAVTNYLDATASVPPDRPVPWYGGHLIDLATTHGVVTGEAMVHGLDMARAARVSWPMDGTDATVAVLGGMGVLPTLVDREATSGVEATIQVRLRGGPRWRILVDDGRIWIAGPGTADCHVSADPVTYLLVGFGRIPQWKPILAGQVVAWGRRPWLAGRLTDWLVSV